MTTISTEALRKVNAIRQQAGLAKLTKKKLVEALDWTDLPRSVNLVAACLPRFGAVLGHRVTNNVDGGVVFLCVQSERVALELGAAIGGVGRRWKAGHGMNPRDYTGYAIVLPRDVVELATEASRAVHAAWYSK